MCIGFLQTCINQIWLFTSGDRPLNVTIRKTWLSFEPVFSAESVCNFSTVGWIYRRTPQRLVKGANRLINTLPFDLKSVESTFSPRLVWLRHHSCRCYYPPDHWSTSRLSSLTTFSFLLLLRRIPKEMLQGLVYHRSLDLSAQHKTLLNNMLVSSTSWREYTFFCIFSQYFGDWSLFDL